MKVDRRTFCHMSMILSKSENAELYMKILMILMSILYYYCIIVVIICRGL